VCANKFSLTSWRSFVEADMVGNGNKQKKIPH